MHQGTIIWYNAEKGHGIVSVTENGIIQRYFLLFSRISRSPEIIKAGQFVRFQMALPAPKPWLLPMPQSAEISNSPFLDAGIAALQSTPPQNGGAQ